MPADQTFLLPGEMAWLREPGSIATLLGSCVAVCLHDRRRSWGGMNHYMVPDQTGSLPPGKIGASAIDGLVRLATMAGSNVGDLDARLVGGGAVISVATLGSASVLGDIGTRNIAIAEQRLQELRIPVVRRDVGGDRGRRVAMETATGMITVTVMGGAPGSDRPVRRRPAGQKARVLVIDDSALVRQLLSGVINGAGDLEVCGEAENPYEARERILDLDPDVLCLDLIMPRLDGLSFLRRLMQYKPIPTVVVSTIAKAGSAMRSKVLEAGAVDALDKEDLALYADRAKAERLLLPTLRRAAVTPVSIRSQGASP